MLRCCRWLDREFKLANLVCGPSRKTMRMASSSGLTQLSCFTDRTGANPSHLVKTFTQSEEPVYTLRNLERGRECQRQQSMHANATVYREDHRRHRQPHGALTFGGSISSLIPSLPRSATGTVLPAHCMLSRSMFQHTHAHATLLLEMKDTCANAHTHEAYGISYPHRYACAPGQLLHTAEYT
jgi:hypothetical protein